MHIPLSTYRIQLTPHFGFKSVLSVVSYLAEVGISDIYASPIFQARKGSQHGYDVVDPNKFNPELGGEEDFDELLGELKNRNMNWLQDIVPNHMAYDSQNQMLMDVLENGPSSLYFDFFDVDWSHSYEKLRGRILAPFLGKFYGECLEDGEIQLRYGKEGLTINYYELKFPVKIESYLSVFSDGLVDLRRKLGREHPDFIKLLGLFYTLRNLPTHASDRERHYQISFTKNLFWELYTQNSDIREFADRNIEKLNGEPGNPQSFALLDELLAEQFFRLAFWKVAAEELNYRRFFNINDLITLRTEDEQVLQKTHNLIFELIREGKITGLRIDHVDGLFHPQQYLRKLRQQSESMYLVVEKILDFSEELPDRWPIQGSTGYDFLNVVNGLFCRKENETKFNKTYVNFTQNDIRFQRLVYEKKKLIIEKLMASDVDNLAHLMLMISSRHRYGSDFTLYGLKRILVEVLALFPVYRTYVSEKEIRESDRVCIIATINRARETLPDLVNELDMLENLLLLKFGKQVTEEEKQQRLYFAMRFQQFSGPLMAKGFEDTVLYNYNRLLSLNEVGGNPEKFGISVIEFHHFNKKRATRWPHSMNATATHDTKRGEDVRARLNVLSEIPEEWERKLKLWSKLNASKKSTVRGSDVPAPNDEYFLYQTLLGAYPFDKSAYAEFVERIKSYIIKAIREAKVHTAWLKPDEEYEAAYLSFIDEILTDNEQNVFLKDFKPFQKKIARYGMLNSLSQTLVKITAPGLPDFYQGTELWDLNLVDPDNRRPADYEKRKVALREIKQRIEANIVQLLKELYENREDGRIKLFLIHQALSARRRYAAVFQKGAYLPLEVRGKLKEHVVAFARNHHDVILLTIVPRFLSTIAEDAMPLGSEVWQDMQVSVNMEVAVWRNVLTSEEISGSVHLMVGDVLQHFPVALLAGQTRTAD